MRSTAWSSVDGCPLEFCIVLCAAATPGIVANRSTAKNVALRERIGPSENSENSVRNLKNNVNGRWEIHGMAFLQCRLEANLLRSAQGRFIQSVPKAFR